MDEPLSILPVGPEPESPAAAREDARAADRRTLLRRLRVLLLTTGVAFALTTWMLVRVESPGGLLWFARGPAGVVRAHLQALNRGELRTAYECFSRHYRQQVPFEAYHQLVVSHRRMFRTREVAFAPREQSPERAVIETRMVAADGERYVARFTLVQVDGRWWIEDVRWGALGRRALSVI